MFNNHLNMNFYITNIICLLDLPTYTHYQGDLQPITPLHPLRKEACKARAWQVEVLPFRWRFEESKKLKVLGIELHSCLTSESLLEAIDLFRLSTGYMSPFSMFNPSLVSSKMSQNHNLLPHAEVFSQLRIWCYG